MNFKTSALVTAVLLGATFSAGGFAQDGDADDTRRGPAFGHGHGQHLDSAAPRGRRGADFRRRGAKLERALDRLDTDADALISFEEFSAGRLETVDRVFERLDRDGDGLLSNAELEGPRRPQGSRRPDIDREAVAGCVHETIAGYDPEAPDGRFDDADTGGDGYLDLAELGAALDERARERFERLDADADGFVSQEELTARRERQIELRRALRTCIREAASAG